MDLARPITAVVPTLDGPVLQTLARTTSPLTGRQVHLLAGGGSEAGVRRVLNRLAAQGIVHVTRSGQALLYVANREHVAWPVVEALSRIPDALVERLRAEFRSWSVEPVTAVLFGSAARGEGGLDSDIDVLVVGKSVGYETPEYNRWQAQIDGLRERVMAWTGNRCQIFELDAEEFYGYVHRGEPIVADWKRDGILLHGDPINRLIAAKTSGERD